MMHLNPVMYVLYDFAKICASVFFRCDVTDRAAVFRVAEKVSKEVGDVTILVNNAGIMPCKPILKHSEKEIRAEVDINVIGNLWVSQTPENDGHQNPIKILIHS